MLKPIIQLPSKNTYSLNEPAYIIILHTTLGSYTGAVDWLRNIRGQNYNSSAHFVVGRLGETAQLALLTEGTWHAGAVSNPSIPARNVCRKSLWGTVKNPNKYSIGIEVASGYDIDKDGIIESWEKLYSAQQIKQVAELILEIERQTGRTFSSEHILTHRDISSYKPNLDLMKAMVVAEMDRIKYPSPSVTPAPSESELDVFLKNGDKVRGTVTGFKLILSKD